MNKSTNKDLKTDTGKGKQNMGFFSTIANITNSIIKNNKLVEVETQRTKPITMNTQGLNAELFKVREPVIEQKQQQMR